MGARSILMPDVGEGVAVAHLDLDVAPLGDLHRDEVVVLVENPAQKHRRHQLFSLTTRGAPRSQRTLCGG